VSVPAVRGVQLGGAADQPLLLLGPSLGTSVTGLWAACTAGLAEHFQLLGWELPGHGGAPVAEPFTIAELAAGVLGLVDSVQAERGDPGEPFGYAGVSVGGAVGLQLLLAAPSRVRSAALICTGARIGEAAAWADRAALVRASGTPAVVTSSAGRWFAPGFSARQPAVGAALLRDLRDADDEGYAQVCEALAAFDVRHRLGEVQAPVLAVAGAEDIATPPSDLQLLATAIPGASLVVLDGVAHLAPAERPDRVTELLLSHLTPPDEPVAERPEAVDGPSTGPGDRADPDTMTDPDTMADPDTMTDPYAAGLAVRREVLGDAHVDRATAATTDFTAEFQQLITRYAWGTIWTRPGLDRRSRSLITLTALVARGHHEELAMHVRAARTNGLSDGEIKELLLQTAIYCGVPDANTAFRIAARVLAELDEEQRPGPDQQEEDR
jgi:3-oxoadipate enol-lactonase/4-carboxymuconolactone decarboxylase